mmetsp:Transcript_21264/g.44292  ORF Transcript_21264/g.44292 Transcript_21264/m.44292 type:complete len:246 (+) Transcript_21264:104-841(+)
MLNWLESVGGSSFTTLVGDGIADGMLLGPGVGTGDHPPPSPRTNSSLANMLAKSISISSTPPTSMFPPKPAKSALSLLLCMLTFLLRFPGGGGFSWSCCARPPIWSPCDMFHLRLGGLGVVVEEEIVGVGPKLSSCTERPDFLGCDPVLPLSAVPTDDIDSVLCLSSLIFSATSPAAASALACLSLSYMSIWMSLSIICFCIICCSNECKLMAFLAFMLLLSIALWLGGGGGDAAIIPNAVGGGW